LARAKAEGIKLGRPIGSKNRKMKLSGKEDEIKILIKNKTSICEIARIYKVHRLTVNAFINSIRYNSDT